MKETRSTSAFSGCALKEFFKSAEFDEVMNVIIQKHTDGLIQKINVLELEVKNLRESNIDLVRLLTNGHNANITCNNSESALLNYNYRNSSNESLDSVSTVIEQNMLDHKNTNFATKSDGNCDKEGFIPVYKKRKDKGRTELKNQNTNNNKRVIIGSSIEDGENIEDTSFQGANKKMWIYVGRCEEGVQEQNIKMYLEKKCPSKRFIVQALRKTGNPSFKIGADYDLEDTLYTSSFWPQKVLVKPFEFFTKKPKFFRSINQSRSYRRY